MDDTYYSRHREEILAKAKERRKVHGEKYRQDYKTWYDLNKKELYERRKKTKALKPKSPTAVISVPVAVPVAVLSERHPTPPRVEYIAHEIIVSFE